MKKKQFFFEQPILFVSITKWFILATVIGVIVGVSTSYFLKALEWSTDSAHRFPYYFVLLPFAFFVSAAMIKYLAPDAEGHGTEKVIEAIHKKFGKIKAEVVPVKIAATIVTLALGGSAGKEGPCAQIGGGLSSIFADLIRFDEHDHRKLVICGISAGFASVFGTPIAGAIFGVEVLFVGTLLYDVLLPSFVSGLVSFEISSALGITYFHYPIQRVHVFTEPFMLEVVIAGLFFGLVAMFLIELLNLGKSVSERIKIWEPFKGLIGGAALVVLAFIFSRDYLGLGLNTIESSLKGEETVWYAFIMKAVFTSITLNFGGSGGIVTAIFFVGSTAGVLFARIAGSDIATFAALGMTGVLAGAANAPIAASIMAVELFGPEIAPYAALACVISFLMTGHRSVYPSQVLTIKKSASIEVEEGGTLEELEVRFRPRHKSLLGAAQSILKKRRRRKEAQKPDNSDKGKQQEP